jgi:hypothetical protein
MKYGCCRYNIGQVLTLGGSTSTMVREMLMVKMACERLERSLSLVLLVERFSMQSS